MGFAIIVMGLSLVLTLSQSGITCFMIALAISGMAVIQHQAERSKRTLVVSYLAFVAILSVSWVGLDAITARFLGVDWTLEGRLFAWQDALRIFRAFPKTGSGLNTYGVATVLYQTFQTDTAHFAEAHNDYLQYLAEGGLLLVIPTLVLIGLFVREVRHRFREGFDDSTGYWLRLGAVTGLVAIALQEIVEFSVQMPGNAALFAVVVRDRRAKGKRHASHRPKVKSSGMLKLMVHLGVQTLDRCPACTSPDIHRSRSRTKWENWRKGITGKRPYRCNTCGWRGWAVDEGPKFADREIKMATRVLAPEPPNLKSTVLARTEEVPELDLTKLDSLTLIDGKPDE